MAWTYGSKIGSAQYVVIVQYPIEEEKGSVGSSSLHVEHYPKIVFKKPVREVKTVFLHCST